MHETKQNLKKMKQISLFYGLLRKTTHILLPFSIFSFLFLHPTCVLFIHSLVTNLSTFYLQIVSLASDKNYIFLLCNGILVFVAKYPYRTVDTKPALVQEAMPQNDELAIVDFIPCEYEDKIVKIQVNELIHEETEEEPIRLYNIEAQSTLYNLIEDENKYMVIEEKQEQEEMQQELPYGNIHRDFPSVENEYVKDIVENKDMFEDKEEEMQQEHPYENIHRDFPSAENTYMTNIVENKDMFEDEEEEEYKYEYEYKYEKQEETIAKMSTEELNRKFDDFIRKMKDELRFEARQQLITV